MSEAQERKVEAIVERYGGDRGMLIPMMQDLQAAEGYLPAEQLRRLSRALGVPLARVYSVATFYSSFRLAPKGQHEVTLCLGTVCHLKGAPHVLEAIKQEFQVEPGGTTPDGLFTLQGLNCVGACAMAPVMIVDGKYYDGVTPQSALELVKSLGKAERPQGQDAGGGKELRA